MHYSLCVIQDTHLIKQMIVCVREIWSSLPLLVHMQQIKDLNYLCLSKDSQMVS